MPAPNNGLLLANKLMLQGGLGAGVSLTQQLAAEFQEVPVPFPSFQGGLNFSDAEQDQNPAFTQETYNVELADGDRLRRMPGHLVQETMSGRIVRRMFVHPSLDFSAELVLLDSPHIGIKASGATSWANASLPAGHNWVGLANGDDFLLTNGATGIYQRAFGSAAGATLIANSPAGVTMANFAGRVLVGGPTIGSNYQALGVYWNGASGSITDWLGLGSGAELLVSNTPTDDRVVALRPMSFDLCGVLCQKSVWVGLRTGDPYRPVDFQFRVGGVGCLAERTAIVTPGGLMFLGESGVYVFDGNSTQLVSDAVNAELLPVLSDAIDSYHATYDPVESIYWLYTPTWTWCFEIRSNRWTRSTQRVDSAVAYSEQFAGLTWNNALGTWEASTDTWASSSPAPGKTVMVMARGADLAVPSRASTTFMGAFPVEAAFGFLRKDTPHVNSLFTTQRAYLRYVGQGDVQVWLPDNNGVMQLVTTRSVPLTSLEDSAAMGLQYTGRGTGAQMRWTNPDLLLSHAAVSGVMRSRRIGML